MTNQQKIDAQATKDFTNEVIQIANEHGAIAVRKLLNELALANILYVPVKDREEFLKALRERVQEGK